MATQGVSPLQRLFILWITNSPLKLHLKGLCSFILFKNIHTVQLCVPWSCFWRQFASAGVTNFIIRGVCYYSPCLLMYVCIYVQNVPATCGASLHPWLSILYIYSTCTHGVSRGPRKPREGRSGFFCRLLKSSRWRHPVKWPPGAHLMAAPDPEGGGGC